MKTSVNQDENRSTQQFMSVLIVCLCIVTIISFIFQLCNYEVALGYPGRMRQEAEKAQYEKEQRELRELLEDPIQIPMDLPAIRMFLNLGSQDGINLSVANASQEQNESDDLEAQFSKLKERFANAELVVTRGEAALHAEGCCEACDLLREMYRDGELLDLYYVEAVPGHTEPDDIFQIEVTTDELDNVAILQCQDGILVECEARRANGQVDFKTEHIAPFGVIREDRFADIEGYGIELNGITEKTVHPARKVSSDSGEGVTHATKNKSAHINVYVPDDEEEPEQDTKDDYDYIGLALLGIAVVAMLISILLLARPQGKLASKEPKIDL